MFKDSIDFYRRNPIVLLAALVAGAVLVFLVLVDGDGIGIGELLAFLAFGVLFGVAIQFIRNRGLR